MTSSFTVQQNTRTGTIALALFGLAIVALAMVPFMGNTLAIQWTRELLMLLALASLWNLLAGYAGLVSVGQQAFVGFGAYAFLHLASAPTRFLARTGVD